MNDFGIEMQREPITARDLSGNSVVIRVFQDERRGFTPWKFPITTGPKKYETVDELPINRIGLGQYEIVGTREKLFTDGADD
jgi:hypothetical protein